MKYRLICEYPPKKSIKIHMSRHKKTTSIHAVVLLQKRKKNHPVKDGFSVYKYFQKQFLGLFFVVPSRLAQTASSTQETISNSFSSWLR